MCRLAHIGYITLLWFYYQEKDAFIFYNNKYTKKPYHHIPVAEGPQPNGLGLSPVVSLSKHSQEIDAQQRVSGQVFVEHTHYYLFISLLLFLLGIGVKS